MHALRPRVARLRRAAHRLQQILFDRLRSVEVLAGIYLCEIDIPFGLVGKSLAQADLRNRCGVEVLLIHTSAAGPDSLEGRPGKLPTPQAVLEAGDRLLVMGTTDAIENLHRGVGTTVGGTRPGDHPED